MATIAPLEPTRGDRAADGLGNEEASGRRGPRTKKEQRRASTERLLAAALRLFITQGYLATSVEQIGRDASLTKGAVYFYFGAKAELLLALLERVEALTVEPSIAEGQTFVDINSVSPGRKQETASFLTARGATLGARRARASSRDDSVDRDRVDRQRGQGLSETPPGQQNRAAGEQPWRTYRSKLID